ncbi:MAG: hypothetical protein PHT07_04180 [Paludibacter sp.]|nr:hypothetical protein [Paludibacter sp.]
MKKYLFYLFSVLLVAIPVYSQEMINNTTPASPKSIQQILLPGIDDVLISQNLNSAVSNYVFTLQKGNSNSASINQQYRTNSDISNQTYSVQSGNSNELTLGQIGSGNLLLGYQLDLMSSSIGDKKDIQAGIQDPSLLKGMKPDSKDVTLETGERNKMIINQQGTDNGVVAIQQGSDNIISADQIGKNNYFLALQIGSNNSVNRYTQENESDHILYDRVIQIGDNLSLKSDESSKSSLKGNTFLQTGNNLALEINSDLLNSAGGIEINQKGNNMKVVIDQSYFSFPLK